MSWNVTVTVEELLATSATTIPTATITTMRPTIHLPRLLLWVLPTATDAVTPGANGGSPGEVGVKGGSPDDGGASGRRTVGFVVGSWTGGGGRSSGTGKEGTGFGPVG